MTSVDAIRNELLGMRDDKYRAFHSKLMPTVDFERVIGVRTPQLRKYAVSLSKTQQADAFLKDLPHYYYEENIILGASRILGDSEESEINLIDIHQINTIIINDNVVYKK